MGYVVPKKRTKLEWRDLSTSSARWAAPWWLLTWIITGGRFGKPLFRFIEVERSPRPSSPPPQEQRQEGPDCPIGPSRLFVERPSGNSLVFCPTPDQAHKLWDSIGKRLILSPASDSPSGFSLREPIPDLDDRAMGERGIIVVEANPTAPIVGSGIACMEYRAIEDPQDEVDERSLGDLSTREEGDPAPPDPPPIFEYISP